jgi:hypothetical protein
MTLGALAKAFGEIQNQTYKDSVAEKTLLIINKDRVNVVHHRTRANAERRLRVNVGKHMWAITEAAKVICE